jgi:hypothetical protein
LPAAPEHDGRMMTGDQCRTKARRARGIAPRSPLGLVRDEWTATATEWLKLAATADAQAVLQQTLLDKELG